MTGEPLLRIRDLAVSFGAGADEVDAVRGVTLDIGRGETVSLVGESGSGKSATALSILQLLPYPLARHPAGSILFEGEEMIGAAPATLRRIRGNRVGMIFQEPMTSLNPLHKVEDQIGEALRLHKGMGEAAARARTLELLALVGIPEPARRLGAYPHELSGGQRQRVMIAMALANDPALLIADEPTTALDVTIQAQILALLKDLQAKLGMALLLITHDLGIVRKMGGRVAVMTAGEIVETGPVDAVFAAPRHAYTKKLMAATPGTLPPRDGATPPILMEAQDLKVYFAIKAGVLRRTVDEIKAVDGVTLNLREGRTLGVVGESGSGKTTLGFALLRLTRSQGAIRFQGQPIDQLSSRGARPLRKAMQIVFQDPYGSLSPRLSVGQIIEEGLLVHERALDEAAREALIVEALGEVGLDPETRHRYPHEFSGGQRQRVAIARAIVLKPRLVVLDEPTSALDVSVQAQIVELLRDLQRRHGLAYLFISHDLRVVRALADEILVMHAGKVVEAGPAERIFRAPEAPYTKALLAAALNLETATIN